MAIAEDDLERALAKLDCVTPELTQCPTLAAKQGFMVPMDTLATNVGVYAATVNRRVEARNPQHDHEIIHEMLFREIWAENRKELVLRIRNDAKAMMAPILIEYGGRVAHRRRNCAREDAEVSADTHRKGVDLRRPLGFLILIFALFLWFLRPVPPVSPLRVLPAALRLAVVGVNALLECECVLAQSFVSASRALPLDP